MTDLDAVCDWMEEHGADPELLAIVRARVGREARAEAGEVRPGPGWSAVLDARIAAAERAARGAVDREFAPMAEVRDRIDRLGSEAAIDFETGVGVVLSLLIVAAFVGLLVFA